MTIFNLFNVFTVILVINAISFGSVESDALLKIDQNVQAHNGSNKKIIKILASSDGKVYRQLDVPGGIRPGRTVEVNLDTQDPQDCEWHLKAQYADRSESKSVQLNVCESDATVEFE